MKETIVIFANSVKHGQHCVAGKLLRNGAWVRLVADVSGAALSNEQAKFNNLHGRFNVKPLQKISMGLLQHVPLPHQPENCISDGDWNQQYRIDSSALEAYVDNPDSLWGPYGRVSQMSILTKDINVSQSLYLIKADNLKLYKADEKRRVTFEYKGEAYDLPVTDPNFDSIFSGARTHNNYVCVSLGEAYKEYHYKIVAALL